jgi:hypothetical protein
VDKRKSIGNPIDLSSWLKRKSRKIFGRGLSVLFAFLSGEEMNTLPGGIFFLLFRPDVSMVAVGMIQG